MATHAANTIPTPASANANASGNQRSNHSVSRRPMAGSQEPAEFSLGEVGLLLGFSEILDKILHKDGRIVIRQLGSFVSHALEDAFPLILIVLYARHAVQIVAHRTGSF